MNPTEPASPDNLPTGAVARPRQRLTMIWIVPLLAVLIGLGLAVKAIVDRGPEVALQFAQAEGLEAGKTRVKFKDVNIGTVKTIALNPNRNSVRVTVQMDKHAEGLLVEDSRFWVVRPRIAAGNISGLATLLSGVYIAVDPGKSEESRSEFIGLEEPPLVTSNTPGRQFRLSADDLGSLDIGSPVYFRRIRVGRVVGYSLQKDGGGVDVRIFIDAPYDTLVTESTRFWHASGLGLSLNADGVKLDMQSLLSLALGGVAFASPETDDEPAARGGPAASYVLHGDQRSALSQPESRVEKYLLTFHESLRGLAVGAPVDYRGLIAGEVSRIDLNFESGDAEFAVLVEVTLYPDRFARRSRQSVDKEITDKLIRQTLDRMVAKGFRAQARTGNLLTGQLYIALDFFPQAKPAKIVRSGRLPPSCRPNRGMLSSLQGSIAADRRSAAFDAQTRRWSDPASGQGSGARSDRHLA